MYCVRPRRSIVPGTILILALALAGCDLTSYRRPAYSEKKVSGVVHDFSTLALDADRFPNGAGLTKEAARILQKWRPSEEEKREILARMESVTKSFVHGGEPVAAGRMKEFTMIVTGYAGAKAHPRREWEYRP
ncbi:MAG: hypothetical protein HYY93_08450 [Planctomycetes bacterium]|nr:hypothetical protein [Planctomycetota bacterium]